MPNIQNECKISCFDAVLNVCFFFFNYFLSNKYRNRDKVGQKKKSRGKQSAKQDTFLSQIMFLFKISKVFHISLQWSINSWTFLNYRIKQYRMKIKQITQLLSKVAIPKSFANLKITNQSNSNVYKPTPYLAHPFLQSIYNISEPLHPYEFEREKIFFEDGGHISLDWCAKKIQNQNPPILFIMHGLTGGSEMNYIKAMMKQASNDGYKSVCMNSRGINSEMTSPIPFTACEHGQLETALDRVQSYYPKSPIYMVGTSFGGNYLMRYLIKNQRPSVKGLIALAPPIDVRQVVCDMPFIYQNFFVKRYIEEVVTKHDSMNFWGQIGLVNMDKVKKTRKLVEFHTELTVKILGLNSIDEMFEIYTIKPQDLKNIKVPTYMMVSKDDPIVSYNSMPLDAIKSNPNIKFVVTEKGGHLCWFEGLIPKRWYPRPALDYLNKIGARRAQEVV